MSFKLENVKNSSYRAFETVLRKLPGDKCMLVDPDLIKPLDRAVSMKFLSAYSVRKVYKIQKLPPEASFDRILYVLPPTKKSIQLIIDHSEVDRKASIKRTKLVAFVPKQTFAVRHLLEAQGLIGGNLQAVDLSFGWMPIDTDLVSLNLPEVYTEYYLYGDTSWPFHFGQMLGCLLENVLDGYTSFETFNVYALGSAAEVTAAGLKSSLVRSELDAHNFSSSAPPQQSSVPPPLTIFFSRNLDYVTPLLVPMTFEALIHEVIGIDNGVLALPNLKKDDCVPPKLNLCSSNLAHYKEVRDSHISTVHSWLRARKSHLDDSSTGVSFSLTAMNRSLASVDADVGRNSNTSRLSDIHAELKPMLALRRELTILFICLEEVMGKMTRKDRVEDLLNAQTEILLSGSGGALAMSSGRESISFGLQRSHAANTMPSEAATGSCADESTCLPVRLAMEWLSTNQGDRLIDGIRLLCLLSVTHDGLADDLYRQVHRHIEHSVGFSVIPLLLALRRLKLLSDRREFSLPLTAPTASGGDQPSSSGSGIIHRGSNISLTQVSAEKLVNSAAGRLITRRKSVYNRLHRLLQLSLASQATMSVEKPAISPTYVFGGQHVPTVVRFAESLWALGLGRTSLEQDSSHLPRATVSVSPLMTGPELLTLDQLNQAMSLLSADEKCAKVCGTLSMRRESAAPTSRNDGDLTATASHGQFVLVVFVGGCTYAEVAALRFAAQRRCWRLLIVTSQIFSSTSLIQQVGMAVVQS